MPSYTCKPTVRRPQVLSNMVDFGMEPQAALDAPRWRLDGVDSCIGPASVNDVTCGPAPVQRNHITSRTPRPRQLQC